MYGVCGRRELRVEAAREEMEYALVVVAVRAAVVSRGTLRLSVANDM